MREDTTERPISPIGTHPRGWNVDGAPEARPGVPMEWSPHAFPGAPPQPVMQRYGREAIAALGLAPTTVYGTALPPRGVSGLLRRAAYGVPDHRTSHWLLLMAADRMDVVEHRLTRAIIWVPLVGVAAGMYLLAGRIYRRRYA